MERASFGHHALSVLFIFHFLTTFSIRSSASLATTNMDYIKKSCTTTIYPSLCYNSISKYSSKIQNNPKILTTTALSITLASTQSSLDSMKNISKGRGLNPRETSAMTDCLDLLSDAGDMLNKSIKEMDHADPGPGFDFKMSNVQTWVSAALTDDDTCMDGFNRKGIRDNIKVMVKKQVSNALQLKSISLTFVNNYAKT